MYCRWRWWRGLRGLCVVLQQCYMVYFYGLAISASAVLRASLYLFIFRYICFLTAAVDCCTQRTGFMNIFLYFVGTQSRDRKYQHNSSSSSSSSSRSSSWVVPTSISETQTKIIYIVPGIVHQPDSMHDVFYSSTPSPLNGTW